MFGISDISGSNAHRAVTASDDSVAELLRRLSSKKQADSAWRDFLEANSPAIMHAIRRYEPDHDQAADCFLDFCGSLSDDDFRKLRSFRPEGPASFTTWLKAVTANFCIDWHRRKYGRMRPLRSIAGLPELEQLVYRHVYILGKSRSQCLHALQARFPDLTEWDIAAINGRLFRVLTPQQRFQLSSRPRLPVSLDAVSATESGTFADSMLDTSPDPEDHAERAQAVRTLKAAMLELPAEQRLLLRLRFEEELTLAEVARLTGEADPFKANRKIQAALARLAQLMQE